MVARDIEKVVLPEYVTRVMFNCFEQQIMTLCQFYYGEFWKLFTEQKFLYSGKESKELNELYEYKGQILISAEKNYGISVSEIEKKDVVFNDRDLYIFEIDREYYDCTRKLEGDGAHDVIVYGQDNNNYYVCDNYYKYPKRCISKKEVDPGIVRYYKVIVDANLGNREVMYSDIFAINIHKEYELLCSAFIKSENTDYSLEIIDLFTVLYQFCNKLSLLIRNIDEKKYTNYLSTCAEVIDEIVKGVSNSVYSIIKCIIRDEDINYGLAKEKMQVCGDKLRVVQKVLVEVKRIIDKEGSIADSLKKQLGKYIEENEEIGVVKESDSVYLTHDKLTILIFLDFFEMENSIIDIDYSEIEGLVTYNDFLLFIYKKVLYQH